MKNNGVGKYIALAAFGFAILIAGLVLVKLLPDAKGILRILPYICVGIGAHIFGGNLGTAIRNYLLIKGPNAAKQIEIEAKDERNIAISNKAKAKSYDLMLVVFGALVFVFAFIQVDIYVVLAFVAAYLFVVFSMVYYLSKYHKEM